MTDLVNQPTSRTHRKVEAATWAAAIAAPLAYALAVVVVGYLPIWNSGPGLAAVSTLLDLAITAALTSAATHSAGYWTRAREGEK